MKIAVLGTGMVGRAVADKFATLGHDVVIGTRDVADTLSRTEPDWLGNPAFPIWHESHQSVGLQTFADAASGSEVVVNATSGAVTLDVLAQTGADNLAGKVLLDIALSLDLSEGMPPMLNVANNDSLAEQIQRAYPAARVVKSLNTMVADVMVDPGRLPAPTNVFVSGDDEAAKAVVTALLREIGWAEESIIDLGDVKGSRAAEMYSRLLFQLADRFGSFEFNISIVRA